MTQPLAWSTDVRNCCSLRESAQGASADESLSVLNADASETLLIDPRAGHGITGGSFSPDGSKVLY